MGTLNVNKVEFVKSAASASQLIYSSVPQIVFAGKSNVGKSSVLNCLLNRKNFARVGSEPGKTIHINYFSIEGKAYFVDLPGYGFAKVSAEEKERWSKLMETYFSRTDSLALGVMIVDARHAPTKDDITMCEYFKNSGHSFVIVANKLDKLKKSEIQPNMDQICKTLQIEQSMVIPFSAQTKAGRENLLNAVFQHL